LIRFSRVVSWLSRYMTVVAGASLVFVMLLTVLDVILRYFGNPITGVYDLVALGGAVVIGFSIPFAAERRVHVFMEMLQQVQNRTVKQVLAVFTRLIAVIISVLIGWNLFRLGLGFHTTGEASLTIQIAYYPIAIGLAVCFFLQTLVFVVQMLEVFAGGSHE
jgi:TRAP-type C4-dicarboxylate transport system permease small subunit